MSLLSVPVKPANADTLGTVRVNTPAATNPVVYRTEEVDELLATKADGSALDETVTLVVEAQADALSAVALAQSGLSTAAAATAAANTAVSTANAASASANAAVAAAAAFPVDDFLGTITSLDADPGDPSTLTGKWWQIGIAGTLSDANAGGLTVEIGDRILCDGVDWLRYATPPTYIPDGSLPVAKLEAAAANLLQNQSGFPSGTILLEMDSNGRVSRWVTEDGVIHGKFDLALGTANGLAMVYDYALGRWTFSLGTVDGELPLGTGAKLDSTRESGTYKFAIVDEVGQIAFAVTHGGAVEGQFPSNAEVVQARGTRTLLADRLGAASHASGAPRLVMHRRDTLRDWARKRTQIQLGQSVQLNLVILGDSWVQAYLTPHYLATRLQAVLGASGPGWCPMSRTTLGAAPGTTAISTHAASVLTGAWTAPAAYDREGPDLGGAESSTAGDRITTTISAGGATAAVIHWLRTGSGGSFRYRVNVGSWTTVSTAGATGIQTTTVAISGAATLDCEVVSGTVRLYGVNLTNTTAGVRIHRCGHSGARWSHFAAAPATRWEESLTSLNPDCVVVCLGTNDQSLGQTAAEVLGHAETLITRLRSVRPGMDIILFTPPQNLAGETDLITGYRDALAQLAWEERVALIDGIALFGEAVSEYDDASPRQLVVASNARHPSAAGDAQITAALLETLL